MPIEQINGIDLYYESHGEGPAVVFLHGAGGNHISWWQQLPTFSERYRCITIDHRGFGASADPQQEGSARFADDLEALLDRLDIERAALVAQSMGGRAASQFALRNPQRVWALVMCDTLGVLVWEELQDRRTELREQRLAAAGDAGVLLRGYMAPRFIEEEPAMTFLYQHVQGLNAPREQASQPDPLPREEVAALAVPSLFVVGTEDPVVAPAIVREIQRVVAGAEYREFEGCGHSVYWENAAEFNPVLEAFLAKHA